MCSLLQRSPWSRAATVPGTGTGRAMLGPKDRTAGVGGRGRTEVHQLSWQREALAVLTANGYINTRTKNSQLVSRP